MTDLPIDQKLALTPEEVEALTGVSARTVRQLAQRGDLRRVPYTARVLIPRLEVDRWLNAEAGAA